MKDKTIRYALIIVICTVVLFFIVNYTFKRILGNAMLLKLVPFIQKFEGGLSRDPRDNASVSPAPWSHDGQTGWHTNKGVTYATFKSLASRAGYEPTKENFFNMPDEIWMKILKVGYMKAFPLDQIPMLPRIQAVMISWAWGSGAGGAERELAKFQRKYFGIKDSNITPSEIVANFKKHVNPLNEAQWFAKLCDEREAFFRSHSDFPTFGKGWLRRLNEFRKLFA